MGTLYVKDMTITVGSLFTGIGGLDLGLERAGMKIRWMVEIDPFCQKVLAKHWPNVTRYDDVRDCGKHNLETVDLICGGFPCQDISSMGQKAGIKGKQSGLWSEFYRIICELRPRYVLMENVADLLIRGMDIVLGDLATSGYDAEWACLPAQAFGAHHKRARVFMVAYPQGLHEQQAQQTRTGDPKNGTEKCVLQNRNRGIFTELPRPDPWLSSEPELDRVVNGLSLRMDKYARLRSLGNAVVPQVAEWIGEQILNYERFISGSQ